MRRELKCASALIWLSRRQLDSPLWRTVEVGDASTAGYGMMACEPPKQVVLQALAVREKWRFVPMPESLKQAAESQDHHLFAAKLGELLGLGQPFGLRHCNVCKAGGIVNSVRRACF